MDGLAVEAEDGDSEDKLEGAKSGLGDEKRKGKG